MREIAWITGASRGIGRSIARKLAKEGYDLALCCKTSMSELEKVKLDCEKFGCSCNIYQCDVSIPEQVTSTGEQIRKDLGEITLLINNAGISYIGLLSDMSCDDWNQIITTNLSSMFYTCKEVIPPMVRKKKGYILNISSIWGSRGASCEVAYSSSKGGVDAFTKSLAKELAPSGISVNALSCGVIDTEMNRHLSEQEKKSLLNEIPSGRMGSCEESAEMIFLLTKTPAYFTGQIVTLDGCWY